MGVIDKKEPQTFKKCLVINLLFFNETTKDE